MSCAQVAVQGCDQVLQAAYTLTRSYDLAAVNTLTE